MKGKGSKGTYEAKNSLHEGGSTEPQVDLLEVHTSSQDVEVSIEGEWATVYDEASMMAGFITSTKGDGATSCPTYDDFEDHDTNANVGQIDCTHVEDAYEDVGVLVPTYDEEATPFPNSYEEEGMMLPTYDGGWVFERLPWDMDHSSHETCVEGSSHESHHSMISPSALGDVDEGSILTDDISDHLDASRTEDSSVAWFGGSLEDHITHVLTRADGSHIFLLMWIPDGGETPGGVTSVQLRIIKDALEQLKSDYWQLFMDMDIALKVCWGQGKRSWGGTLSVGLGTLFTTYDRYSIIFGSSDTGERESLTHDVREETLMMSQDEEQSEMHVPKESDSLVCTLDWHCEDHEHFPLETTLEAQGLAMEEMVEYIPCGPGCKETYIYSDWVDRYMIYGHTMGYRFSHHQ
jgi:hypothetical protein